MAAPRRRAKHPSRKKNRDILWLVPAALLALAAGVGVYLYPVQDEEPAPADSPGPVAPQPEQPQEEEPAPEPAPEPEPEPQPEPTPEPQPEPEPEPVKPEPAPEPVAPPQPDEPAKDGEGGDSDADSGDEDEDESPYRPIRMEVENGGGPFARTMSLVGHSRELQKDWEEVVNLLLEKKDMVSFLSGTDMRISRDVAELFPGKRLNYGTYRLSATLTQAVELSYLVRFVGPKRMRKFVWPRGEEDGRISPTTFLRWCLTDKSRPLHHFLQAFKLNAGNPQTLPYAFNTFYELWKRTQLRDRARYLNLAIACSLVHPSIAESPGMLRLPKEPMLTIPELYDYYMEMDRKHKLLTDVKKLSVTDLLLVVDVRLPKSEFEWVHKKLSYRRSEWGKAYDSVKYIMERATQGEDPYVEYTFEEILEEGGVCRDRAYYAANTAKCMGIPATYVGGDGDRGPHAWVDIMTSDKEWTGSGSYGYKTGRYRNTCSGRSMHESMLLQRGRRMSDDMLDMAANMLLFSEYLSVLGKSEEALGVARYACTSHPFLTAGWVSCMEVMKNLHDQEKLEKNAWRRFQTDMMRFANKNTELLDLAQEVQADYMLDGARATTKKNMLRRTGRKIEKLTANGRTDLLVDSIRRQAQIYADGADYRGLGLFYRQQYKKYADRGDIFASLLRQHISFIDKQEDKRLWKQLARDAEGAYSKYVFQGDYFKVKKDADVMSTIAEVFRRGGEERRADKMDKETRKVLEESARKAEGH